MENPYSPSSQTVEQEPWRVSWGTIAIMIGISVGVAVNYVTATRSSFSIYASFEHVALCLAPFSATAHLIDLIEKRKARTGPLSRLLWVPILALPIAFFLPWSLYFSRNSFESFALTNRYFGPFGNVLWFWLIVFAVLPLVTVIFRSRLPKTILDAISVLAILAHIHNAYIVWTYCHGPA